MNSIRVKLGRFAVNKWRLAFAVFALAYTLILFLYLTRWPIQWDEVTHLNAGNFLYWGLYQKFVLNAFYPPLFDGIMCLSFEAFGVHLLSALNPRIVLNSLSMGNV